MHAILERLRTPVAVAELIAWLPASFMSLTLAAAYVVAGNEPPATLVIGFLMTPIIFLVAPVYALTPHARVRPFWSLVALVSPLTALLLTYIGQLPSLTSRPL